MPPRTETAAGGEDDAGGPPPRGGGLLPVELRQTCKQEAKLWKKQQRERLEEQRASGGEGKDGQRQQEPRGVASAIRREREAWRAAGKR